MLTFAGRRRRRCFSVIVLFSLFIVVVVVIAAQVNECGSPPLVNARARPARNCDGVIIINLLRDWSFVNQHRAD